MLYDPADIARVRGLLEKNNNPDQLRVEMHKLNAMAAFAEAQTTAVQAELMIEQYLGHPPEFAEIRLKREGNW
jgi:superfamily II DNA helicase RecQ